MGETHDGAASTHLARDPGTRHRSSRQRPPVVDRGGRNRPYRMMPTMNHPGTLIVRDSPSRSEGRTSGGEIDGCYYVATSFIRAPAGGRARRVRDHRRSGEGDDVPVALP